jgi:hypothetical protein
MEDGDQVDAHLGQVRVFLWEGFRVSWGAECWECLGRRRVGERKEDTVIFDCGLRAWVIYHVVVVVLVHIPLYPSFPGRHVSSI